MDREQGGEACMHIRTKKWARPELAECPFFVECGEEYRNSWKKRFPNPDRDLHLEMGCGKGVSTAKMVAANPGINFIAVDISPDVLGDARRNMVNACGGNPDNAFLVRTDICLIDRTFGPEDLAQRIYISFCNPWTERPKHEKRRLTHPRQLMQYRSFLADNGEIWFKTDDDRLFTDSLVYLDRCGFEIRYLTWDLHRSGFAPNEMSEHEIRYAQQGVPIKFGIFRKNEAVQVFDPTRYRLTPGTRKATLEKLGADISKEERAAGNGCGKAGEEGEK